MWLKLSYGPLESTKVKLVSINSSRSFPIASGDKEAHGHGHSLGQKDYINWSVIIFACVAAVAIAALSTVTDDRVHEEDGTYKFDFEAGNGIRFSQSGSPDGDEDAVIKTGEYSYTAPDGTPIHVRFVADENGFQPQSDALPVAPEFPHPIPQFVLDQIAFAAEEDAARASQESEEVSSPAGFYRYPQ
ncbi:cuticle protein AMP1A-like [Penaeus monodon]|uniref:cuticle protein AMP1A-like n=1 Tax=Penaeus monodon TaxID=6687 RepID=UPI0018A7B0B4|nr:cuticle protein AMP1A-like [Penaeus monodon]